MAPAEDFGGLFLLMGIKKCDLGLSKLNEGHQNNVLKPPVGIIYNASYYNAIMN
jgi:hypothetical protein